MHLYNYAEDNSMSHSLSTLQDVLSNLLIDCIIVVEWFSNNGMKFQLMTFLPDSADDIESKLDKNTTIRSEKISKALGVIIDNRLTFSGHIRAYCLQAAQQFNSLAPGEFQ